MVAYQKHGYGPFPARGASAAHAVQNHFIIFRARVQKAHGHLPMGQRYFFTQTRCGFYAMRRAFLSGRSLSDKMSLIRISTMASIRMR